MSAPCLRCGSATSHTVVMTGLIEGEIFMCAPCFEFGEREVEDSRAQVAELIAAGASRDEANTIRIARIDGAVPS